jgi:GT2 family glycosyltransferase
VPGQPSAILLVVGLRKAPLLLTCLESIAQNVGDVSYEALVVLNDPSSQLSEEIKREVTGALVTTFRANLGFGGAVNYAARLARGEYLVMLNDDCTVSPGWLESLIETERCHPGCALVGSTFVHPDGSLQEAGSILWSDATTCAVGNGERSALMQFERKVEYCSGGSLLIRKDVWDQLGGFDDCFYPAYYEDADLCMRASRENWETWYQPRSVVSHVRGGSSSRLQQEFMVERSRQTFMKRWSDFLLHQQPNGAVERAIWTAMGCPLRVLVIDDQPPDVSLRSGLDRMGETSSAVGRRTDVHVAFFPTMNPSLLSGGRLLEGIRIIPDLESHLTTHGVDYEFVLMSGSDDENVRDLVTRCLPAARVVYDAEDLFHLLARMPIGKVSAGRVVSPPLSTQIEGAPRR